MIRATRVLFVVLAVVGVAGCSSKHARRDDKPGSDPKVTLAASFPPGTYSGAADVTYKVVVKPEGQSSQTVSVPMRMEMALNVEQSGQRKIGRLTFTRVKMNVMGHDVDTNNPLPPAPPHGPFGPVGQNQPDIDRTLREAMGEMIGLKIEWEILPDG